LSKTGVILNSLAICKCFVICPSVSYCFHVFLTIREMYLACFLMTFEKVVRVTPKRNGSVTVINGAENTKKWKEMGNNSTETRATLLLNTIQDYHSPSMTMVNQF
jgi:hypothetical protein